MNGKRLCSTGHPAVVRGERAGRTFRERTMGVLWRHSSVNLVEPRSIALAAARFPRRLPKIEIAVSITGLTPQLSASDALLPPFVEAPAQGASISH
jgi:hypothetical protein